MSEARSLRLPKKRCAHCSATTGKILLYWSKENLLKRLIKTYYCRDCAKMVVPGADFIKEPTNV